MLYEVITVVHAAAMIPMGSNPGEFDPDSVAPAKERRRMDDRNNFV